MGDLLGSTVTCRWASSDFSNSGYFGPWGNPVKGTFGGQVTLWESLLSLRCGLTTLPLETVTDITELHQPPQPALHGLVRTSGELPPTVPFPEPSPHRVRNLVQLFSLKIYFAALVLLNAPFALDTRCLSFSFESLGRYISSLRQAKEVPEGNDAKHCG